MSDGVDGLVVDHDPAAISGALSRLLDDPGLARRLGAAGREKVLREYSLEVLVSKTRALIAAALARCKANGRKTLKPQDL